ncbi:unnamed protein product [Gongylonema pulchrum]|uniref:Uncharacterized protein n=1 Tax=Gongylonema pulchrum TaxID=637853 RepID=A0A183DUY1_9BILA|nr:unnamed protein product [Gongylonema pulchrum]
MGDDLTCHVQSLSEDKDQTQHQSSLDELVDRSKLALAVDLSTFFERSPCDEKIRKPVPLTSNITVTCCKQCCGNEIKLI